MRASSTPASSAEAHYSSSRLPYADMVALALMPRRAGMKNALALLGGEAQAQQDQDTTHGALKRPSDGGMLQGAPERRHGEGIKHQPDQCHGGKGCTEQQER